MKIINDILLQKKIKFFPHPAQQKIIDLQKRFTIISAGRRFGKSELCAYLALREVIASNRKIWIVSPTYDLSKKVLNYVIKWISQSFPKTFSIRDSVPTIIKSSTGSIIEGKSAENKEGLMGEELDLVIVDEASAMQKGIWETYLYPTLAMRNGKAIFISTPKLQNWFHNLYLKGKSKDDKNKDYINFHFESRDNPYFPIKEWQEAEKTLPKAVFDQEYRAIFLSDAAAVFRNITDIAIGKFEEVCPNHIYVMGVDIGKYEAFTVLTVIDKVTHNVVYFDRFQAIGYPLQKQRIMSAAKMYNDATIVIDSTGVGDPISDDLTHSGYTVQDFKYNNNSKNQLITKLSIFIEKKRITYPYIDVLIDELQSFGYNLSKSNNIQYSAPEGMNDDCVNSLALAVWTLNEDPDSTEESEVITFPITDY